MGVRHRWFLVGVVVALACALPARALASSTEESILMDDQELIYSSPDTVAWTLQQAKALGIDRLKVSVVWSLVVPDPNSRRHPKFDATNPAAYPFGAWTRYDRILSYARDLGLKVYFQIVPPAPVWAQAKGKPAQGYPWSHNPSPSDFEQFVEAVGRRYGGAYIADAANDRARRALAFPRARPRTGLVTADAGAATALPRVDYWGIWNEPNEGAWLNPQWRFTGHGRHKHLHYVAPALYRRLVDAAWRGFVATGHAQDTLLIGETASAGWIYTLPFVRALYCVGTSDKPLTGNRAAQLECPRSGSRSAFAARHPGLFASAGYAHHPYSFDVAPNTRLSNRGLLTLANLGSLERTLGRIFNSYRRHRPGGVPLYLTEWGYKTNPPNPFVKTSLSEQAMWLNEGEYITYHQPYVRALDQFLLLDTKPDNLAPRGSRDYWGTFQTGLLYANGMPKPSYDSFRLPIWLPSAHHGPAVTVWGELRPADHTTTQSAELQFQSKGSTAWVALSDVSTTNPEGFFTTQTAVQGAGLVRISWTDPATGTVRYSRSAVVS